MYAYGVVHVPYTDGGAGVDEGAQAMDGLLKIHPIHHDLVVVIIRKGPIEDAVFLVFISHHAREKTPPGLDGSLMINLVLQVWIAAGEHIAIGVFDAAAQSPVVGSIRFYGIRKRAFHLSDARTERSRGVHVVHQSFYLLLQAARTKIRTFIPQAHI